MLLVVAALRIVELRISKRHQRDMQAQGAGKAKDPIFPVMAIASLAFRIASADAYRRTRETISAITVYLQETLSGIRVVRSFGQEPAHERRFAELNEGNREANMVTVRLNANYFPAVEMLSKGQVSRCRFATSSQPSASNFGT